ncbi:MAG TPA: hypothetical protein VEF89_13375 [Solirubrobacteraceae bacterium]|nr:hypothetical protein [Solirubrobacteraceae bacterium]
MNGERRSSAFVLSGGARLGSVQAGMLAALYERSITPDLIVGFLGARNHLVPARGLPRLILEHARSSSACRRRRCPCT